MCNINDVPMVIVFLSYFSRYGSWRADVRTFVRFTSVRTDSQVKKSVFRSIGIDGYRAPFKRLRRAVALLVFSAFRSWTLSLIVFCFIAANHF